MYSCPCRRQGGSARAEPRQGPAAQRGHRLQNFLKPGPLLPWADPGRGDRWPGCLCRVYAPSEILPGLNFCSRTPTGRHPSHSIWSWLPPAASMGPPTSIRHPNCLSAGNPPLPLGMGPQSHLCIEKALVSQLHLILATARRQAVWTWFHGQATRRFRETQALRAHITLRPGQHPSVHWICSPTNSLVPVW